MNIKLRNILLIAFSLVFISACATAAPEPTETPIPTSGTSVETLPNGLTQYSNYDLGYQIAFPENWVLADIEGGDTLNTLTTAVEGKNPQFPSELLGEIFTGEGSFFAIAVEEGFYNTKTPSFAMSENIEMTGEISLEDIVSAVAQPSEGDEITASGIEENQQGAEMGFVEMLSSIEGTDAKLYSKTFLIKHKNQILIIAFFTGENLLPDLEGQFQEMQDSITLLP